MKALHLICRKNGPGRFEGLVAIDRSKGIYESGTWAFPSGEPLDDLIGGWIYLHPTGKGQVSELGGSVRGIRRGPRLDSNAIREGYVIEFEARPEGRGQKWRGAHHTMAWTSGLVEADLPHEISRAV